MPQQRIPVEISRPMLAITNKIMEETAELTEKNAKVLLEKLREFLWMTLDEMEFDPSDGDLLEIEIQHDEEGCPLDDDLDLEEILE